MILKNKQLFHLYLFLHVGVKRDFRFHHTKRGICDIKVMNRVQFIYSTALIFYLC